MIYTVDPYAHLTADLGWGLTEGELYFWAERKRVHNKPHRVAGHRMCATCDNCLSCNDYWRCLCGIGRKFVTPYRVRASNQREKYLIDNDLIYCLDTGVYVPRAD